MRYIFQRNDMSNCEVADVSFQSVFFFENTTWSKNINITSSSQNKILIILHDASMKIDINFLSEEIKSNIYIICFSSSKNEISSNIKTNISASYCMANKYILSLLTDDTKIDLQANMQISENIQKSEWHLLQENIILWKNIKSKANPALNVFSSDVKASHGLKMQQLDSDKLFYLGSKSLSLDQSKELFVQSYINTILDNFENKILEENNIIAQQIVSQILFQK